MKKLLALVLATAPAVAFTAETPNFDSAVISNIVIVDGTGAPARKGSVRIADGRIVAVGDVLPGNSEIVIDGNGKVLAPGFIDTHSHHDHDIAKSPDMVAVTSQGVTTIIVGQDGLSQSPLRDFFAQLEKNPIAVNLGSYSGHNTLRERGMSAARRPATDAEIATMSQLLEEDMAAGALGLSTGLQYETGNFSTTAEIVALAKVSARLGGRYTSHIRNEGADLMASLQEVVDIGRATGAPVHVSHLKIGAKKLWGTSDKVLELMDDARASGVDLSADIYPYTYWQSTTRVMFPNRADDDGKGSELSMREDDVTRLMSWEHSNICSDGVSVGHPRGHGAFPRVLGHYVREKKAMTLEQAVYKMTGLAAKHLGITDRGTLAEGSSADLVLFDPATVMDRATMENPTRLSAGIEKVWVNGTLVYQDRRTTGVRPGQVVRLPNSAE